MKTFILEFHLKPGTEADVLKRFELHGPNRAPGVSFRNAWIGTQSELLFIVCESNDQRLVEQACQAWTEFGRFQVHPVVSYEQY